MTIFQPKEPSRWVEEINQLTAKGAELISTHGWVQDQMSGAQGEFCIVSAGHEASHVNGTLGLSHVLRELLDYYDRAEAWNDTPSRKKEEVVGYLKDARFVEEDLEAVFGPRWELVLYLAEAFGSMDKEALDSWSEGKDDQAQAYRELVELDRHLYGMDVDPRMSRARNAVASAYAERCVEVGSRIYAPALSLMVTETLAPHFAS